METATGTKPRLQVHYETVVRPKLLREFGYRNPHEVPRLLKIVVNVGIGEAAHNAKLLDSVVEELAAITGQKPVVQRARKSVAGFNIRAGMPVGVSVTLRRARMYEFLDRFINIAVPRIRDFRGFSTRSFDGRGNYSLGLREQVVFPEVDYDKVVQVHGMDITICTSARRDDEALALLREMGFPFRGVEPVLV
jgi:large subunit ribosomal protein L5